MLARSKKEIQHWFGQHAVAHNRGGCHIQWGLKRPERVRRYGTQLFRRRVLQAKMRCHRFTFLQRHLARGIRQGITALHDRFVKQPF